MRCQPQFTVFLLAFYAIYANFSVVIRLKMLNGQLRVNTFLSFILPVPVVAPGRPPRR